MKVKEFALYKGDTYLCGGSKQDLANYLNVSKKTIDYYASKCYLKRMKNGKDYLVVIKVED